MTSHGFEDLQLEFRDELIGSGIYETILELAKLASKRYQLPVYNFGRFWAEGDVVDLGHQVISDQLLSQGQIHRIFATAENLDQLRGLIYHQIKRCLLSRRHKTPIERLTKRIGALLESAEFTKSEHGNEVFFHRETESVVYREITANEVIACVKAARGIPIIYSRRESSREAIIFSQASLRDFLNRIFDVVPAIKIRDFYLILENLLTPWTPTSLVPFDGELQIDDENSQIGQGDTLTTLAQNLVATWSTQDKLLFISKCQDISDERIAGLLNISRPTVAKNKFKLFDEVRGLSQNNPEYEHGDVLDAVIESCSIEIGEEF